MSAASAPGCPGPAGPGPAGGPEGLPPSESLPALEALPAPAGLPVLGHLWHWTVSPLRLLADGAGTGPVFRLRLWRPALVGYRPDWNRALLTDLGTFRSQGSLSGLTPYLSAGVVHTDAPAHRARKRALSRHFSARSIAALSGRLAAAGQQQRPAGTFEALDWSTRVIRHMLGIALFGGALPPGLLRRFLSPLDHPLPVPMLPRPHLFRRLDRAIAAVVAAPPPGSIAAHLAAAGTPAGQAAEDLRVALAAGYDTTSHTLAWAAWHLAAHPEWRHPQRLPPFLAEILRCYPPGWLGSRVTSRDTTVAGVAIPAGTLVCYSPLLTHYDAGLWPQPWEFRPGRFTTGHPVAWSYLPYAAGPRACLGAHLSRLMLQAALAPLCQGELSQCGGDPRPVAGITLRPRGPLLLRAGGR